MPTHSVLISPLSSASDLNIGINQLRLLLALLNKLHHRRHNTPSSLRISLALPLLRDFGRGGDGGGGGGCSAGDRFGCIQASAGAASFFPILGARAINGRFHCAESPPIRRSVVINAAHSPAFLRCYGRAGRRHGPPQSAAIVLLPAAKPGLRPVAGECRNVLLRGGGTEAIVATKDIRVHITSTRRGLRPSGHGVNIMTTFLLAKATWYVASKSKILGMHTVPTRHSVLPVYQSTTPEKVQCTSPVLSCRPTVHLPYMIVLQIYQIPQPEQGSNAFLNKGHLSQS